MRKLISFFMIVAIAQLLMGCDDSPKRMSMGEPPVGQGTNVATTPESNPADIPKPIISTVMTVENKTVRQKTVLVSTDSLKITFTLENPKDSKGTEITEDKWKKNIQGFQCEINGGDASTLGIDERTCTITDGHLKNGLNIINIKTIQLTGIGHKNSENFEVFVKCPLVRDTNSVQQCETWEYKGILGWLPYSGSYCKIIDSTGITNDEKCKCTHFLPQPEIEDTSTACKIPTGFTAI